MLPSPRLANELARTANLSRSFSGSSDALGSGVERGLLRGTNRLRARKRRAVRNACQCQDEKNRQ